MTHQKVRLAILVVGLACALPVPARADGFISPFIGRNFGTETACPNLRDCEGKNSAWGVALGAMGDVVGFEEDINFSNNFLGDAPNFESSVTSFMSNLMVIPKLGPIRPYAVIGLGLIMSRAKLQTPNVEISNNNNIGFDYGGGLAIFFGDHVGIRGDLRVFKTLQDLSVLGFTLGDARLNYARASGALVLKF
jgi:Outer membrane protein beta-barrel domain